MSYTGPEAIEEWGCHLDYRESACSPVVALLLHLLTAAPDVVGGARSRMPDLLLPEGWISVATNGDSRAYGHK